LLTRFLDRTLAARVLPNQREAAVKALLALTDLDRQVRAGVLTPKELDAKLQGDVPPATLAEAVTWLARSDVRLITPQDKGTETGYELAHERLIPALMRLAGKELSAADQANQLLERRVNEWLGNQQSPRYWLGVRELWQIQQQKPYLVWGAKRQQKEKLIALSKRRFYRFAGAVAASALAWAMFWSWWNFIPQGQVQQVQWQLTRLAPQANEGATAQIALAWIKNDQPARGFRLIEKQIRSNQGRASAIKGLAEIAPRLPESRNPLALLERASATANTLNDPYSKARALSNLASAYGPLADDQAAQDALAQALATANTIDNLSNKAEALRAIASVYGQWADGQAAQDGLAKVLAATNTIDNPFDKARALSGIASAYGQLANDQAAQNGLAQVLATANTIDHPYYKVSTLSAMASAYGQLADDQAAQDALALALAIANTIDDDSFSKTEALSAIASAYGQLADDQAALGGLAKVLAAANTIDHPYNKASTLSDMASAYGPLADDQAAQDALAQALATANTIDDPSSKARALSDMASAYGQLADDQAAQDGLAQVLATANTIDHPYYKVSTLSNLASAYGPLADDQAAQTGLAQAFATANTIDDPFYKASALSNLASAYGQLADDQAAQEGLAQVLATANTIDDPSDKANLLRNIAIGASQLSNLNAMHSLLLEVQEAAEQSKTYDTLGRIADLQALFGDWGAALRTLDRASNQVKVVALAQMLTYHAESQLPQLIEGPKILKVDAKPEAAGSYQVTVILQSPEQDCDDYADWWEVLSEDGSLLGRHLLEEPQGFEKPFESQAVVSVEDPNQVLIIRAHFSSDMDETFANYDNELILVDEIPSSKYPNQAMKGSIETGFKSVRIPRRFAAKVERQDPQPGPCREKP
jgi:hypothetical protein